ncbi:MAG: methionyl-tRNA formyltransferase [bacterium]|nr:methionyl-tRNA formyltransferase [bacterium]
MTQPTKIIFFGTSDFAVPALQALSAAEQQIVLVITTPDEIAGRQKVLTASPVKIAAQILGLDLIQPSSLRNNPELIEKIKGSGASLGIVASYGKIIPKEILDLFPLGLLNIHPSLLPKYRGPSPIQSAILNGEKSTGITIMLVDEEVDHGAILSQTQYQLATSKYYGEIRAELARLGADLLIKTLVGYRLGESIPQPQDHTLATFTKKFSFAEGEINWHRSAEEILNQIRALNPEPGTWTTRTDKAGEIFKISKAVVVPETTPLPPGSGLISGSRLLVSTGQGTLALEEVQPAGKKVMPIKSFLNGLGKLEKIDFSR